MVLAGNYTEAKAGASSHADLARSTGRNEDASGAGLVWQVANAFESAKASILEEDFSAAKNHASTAANQARALGGTGCVAEGDLKMAIDNAGQLWTEANKAAEAKIAGSAAGGQGVGRYQPTVPANDVPAPEIAVGDQPASIFGGDLVSEKSLDEVILSYLSDDDEAEGQ